MGSYAGIEPRGVKIWIQAEAATHGVTVYAYMLHLYEQSRWSRKRLLDNLGYTSPSSLSVLLQNLHVELPNGGSMLRREALTLRMDYGEYLCMKVRQYGSVKTWATAESVSRQNIHNDFIREGISSSSREFIHIAGAATWHTATRMAQLLKTPTVAAFHKRAEKYGTTLAQEVVSELRRRKVEAEIVAPLGRPIEEVAMYAPFRVTGYAARDGIYIVTNTGRKLKVVK